MTSTVKETCTSWILKGGGGHSPGGSHGEIHSSWEAEEGSKGNMGQSLPCRLPSEGMNLSGGQPI